MIRHFLLLLVIGWMTPPAAQAETSPLPPNILWITIEDWSADLSCYGTPGIHTPNVDALAAAGVRYDRAFTTSPVCSTSRSAMMTGFHQNRIGAAQHRTDDKNPLPDGIRPVPHLMAQAGYFTCLMSRKTDVNFLPDTKGQLFEGTDWSQRAEGQPFFARITFAGTHRPWKRDPVAPIDPADIELPPYYADTDLIRRDWANGLEQMQLVDREIGQLLDRLDREGLRENTLVFLIADHGRCHFRGKQFLYDEGTRVPLIVRWPGHIEPGSVNQDMVMAIDLPATCLDVAGAASPVPLHGQSLMGDGPANRSYTFAARDKMDVTHDAMRSIRSKTHKLILNLMPERAYCQFSFYKEGAYPGLAEMNVLNLQGKLSPEQAAFMAATKPEVELYDLREDPHEVHNLADDPGSADVRAELLAELDRWRREIIGDRGVSDEFRGAGVYPPECPELPVGKWSAEHGDLETMKRHGAPPWYPTRTLPQWQRVRELWEPWVFREPNSKIKRPRIPFTDKPY